jgi:hypothetical protein
VVTNIEVTDFIVPDHSTTSGLKSDKRLITESEIFQFPR